MQFSDAANSLSRCLDAPSLIPILTKQQLACYSSDKLIQHKSAVAWGIRDVKK